ncbi:peptidyl-prolyl cis-trans isomerase G [Bicyclus anynana]|uniref:Peptidyl-prolyl cis-trans isomerase G n=1 Tax=Bicyclus anynana TaxID=110368 RepID=A0A6J1N508_BICAN|nr:peptidyl-prolyl cis-trans isomerase G [Bicyclus anynana]
MLSDESSSDSETGRFKGQTKRQDDKSNTSTKKENVFGRSIGRNRRSADRFNREGDRRRHEREKFEQRSRERHRYSRYSPVRKYSRDRSRERSKRSSERYRDRRRTHSKPREEKSKQRESRSTSKGKHIHSRPRSQKSPVNTRNVRDEIKGLISNKDRSSEKIEKQSWDEKSSSPEPVVKKSVVQKPTTEARKKKSDSPILLDVHGNSEGSDEVQPGSYYNMIPAIVKEKLEDTEVISEDSSEIDSSDDERLRAKLLNLEKELQKTKKKKHRRKHKRKTSKSDKDKRDSSASVEVTSTTDIPDVVIESSLLASAEVSSTQKTAQKESSEEGEILSDDSQSDIDPNDLRHKLKRSKTSQGQQNRDAWGPALPPHLDKNFKESASPEGPLLPPHLQRKGHNIGPSIPEDMRKVLAENSEIIHEVIHDSSDDDGIGPLPAGAENKWTEAHQHLEERAMEMKIKKLDGYSLKNSNIKSREQWMLELPEGKTKYLGLEARSFRAKEGPDMSDRSSWTDTPEDKARKALGIPKEEDTNVTLQREARERHVARRDEEQEKAAKKHKKKHKREESLLDMHQKKLKKKKKKEDKDEEKKERRPFSRDQDLQVNRFDEAQKRSIIKKAQGLNTRFSSGEAKYL